MIDSMKKLIEQFPQNISDALEIASLKPINKSSTFINNVVICGMGGSGFGGKLISDWLINHIEIPVILCSDYDIPKFVNANTLFIASSYSGNTEETISAVNKAKNKNAFIIGVTSGGKLKSFCEEFEYQCILIPGGKPPRTQLGYSMVQLVHILSALNLIEPTFLNNIQDIPLFLEEEIEAIQNTARELAIFIHRKDLRIYSTTNDEALCIRARQQFNENAKILCSHHVIPEMNHNELVGWAGAHEKIAVLLIVADELSTQNAKRFAFFEEVISSKTKHLFQLNSKGSNIVEKSIYAIHVIDWASYYLSEMNDVDATEIEVINKLKHSLSNAN
jgi:glucose/mannose-6-phosphate isomerase